MTMNSKYCTKCSNSTSDPTLEFNDEFLCNICQKATMEASIESLKEISKKTEEYENSLEKDLPSGQYHCLLMLSGGKDSINILKELLDSGKKIIAYTFEHPFLSPNAKDNLNRITDRLDFEHHKYRMDPASFYRLVITGFTSQEKSKRIEDSLKRPCYLCGNIMLVHGLSMAFQKGIPYILYCADPVQMLGMPQTLKDVVDLMIAYLGKPFVEGIIPVEMLNRIILGDTEDMPQIIFPYSSRDYNPKKIIASLKKDKLYETSPVQTHCQLLPLLNYYSIKRYDSFFYSHEFASMVRKKIVPRDMAISYIEEYKDMLMTIAVKDKVEEKDEEKIYACLKKQYRNESMKEQLNYELECIKELPQLIRRIGLDINEI